MTPSAIVYAKNNLMNILPQRMLLDRVASKVVKAEGARNPSCASEDKAWRAAGGGACGGPRKRAGGGPVGGTMGALRSPWAVREWDENGSGVDVGISRTSHSRLHLRHRRTG